MMAGEFEIARQATLEEVKQTGIETQQTVNETKTTIGDIGDPAGEESLVGLIKDIPEKVPTGAVKSVQRGIADFPSASLTVEVKITINAVNPQKSFVLLYSDVRSGSDKSFGAGLIVKEFASNYLVVASDRGYGRFCWQVIECF